MGDRPWLVSDDRATEELALRNALFQADASAVHVAPPAHVGREVLDLVTSHAHVRPGPAPEPLAAAGLAVQEDLCLLRRRDGAWHLDAALLCFPSRWRLDHKIGRPLVDVHAPTPGYRDHLASRVDRLLDRLTGRPVLRRNWFIHPDPQLHQPEAPAIDPIVPADRVAEALHVRSERQTLRRLECGWVLFTIRVQHEPLGVVLRSDEHRGRLARYVALAPMSDLAHRGMAPDQVSELCDALGIAVRDPKSDTTSDS